MSDDLTHQASERKCGRCGASVPADQECCVACLASDLKSTVDDYFDPAPASGIKLEGSDFTILEEIGRGGMGVVFRARQASPARDVAIKVLLPHLAASPEIRRRLFAEAAAMAELNHPGILPLFASGESDGQPWLAMKLASGGTLSARRTDWVGQWRPTAELLAGLSDALQHAHERGLIHRDVKPGNILFDETGRACLADFGLVKWRDAEASDTLSHAMLGTPAYLAPEVAQNGAHVATTASDVYGLGAILYELLTGAPPFKGAATAELLHRIATEDPQPPRRIRQDIPVDLEIICQKALSKEPHSRYPTAAAFGADLRRWLTGKAISARRFSTGEKLIRWARRNPLPASLAAALAVAVLAGSIAVWIKNRDLTASIAELAEANAKARKSRDAAENRVAFMIGELPPLLEPAGPLAVLNPVFENVHEYYETFGDSTTSAGLARQAQFNMQWAHVLSLQGKGGDSLEKLKTANSLASLALSQGDASVDAWAALVAAQRRLGEHAAKQDDFLEAERIIKAACSAAEEGLRRFPGELALRAELADALTELGHMTLARGETDDQGLAKTLLVDALQQWKALARDAGSGVEKLQLRIRRKEAYCLFEVALASLAMGDPRSALDYFRENLAAREQLAKLYPTSAVERRYLCTACNRVADTLFRANEAEGKKTPREEIEEIEQLLSKAEGLSNWLVAHEAANLGAQAEVGWSSAFNQVWRSEWALSALAMGHLENYRGNSEASRQWLVKTLQRLEWVTDSAVPVVHEYRAESLKYLAQSEAAASDDAAAREHWNNALAEKFQHLCAHPDRWLTHSGWADFFMEGLDFQKATVQLSTVEENLKSWLEKVERQMTTPNAPLWWRWTAASVHRRLADVYRDLNSPELAAHSNRKALELRSGLLLAEKRCSKSLLPGVANAARNLLDSTPGIEDRKTVARCLTNGAACAARLDPKGGWRTEWSKLIRSALEPLDSAGSAPLAREARFAMFPEPSSQEWTAEEKKEQELLRELEKGSLTNSRLPSPP